MNGNESLTTTEIKKQNCKKVFDYLYQNQRTSKQTIAQALPARSRREPFGKVSILAPRQESMVASSSSEIPEKSAAAWYFSQ